MQGYILTNYSRLERERFLQRINQVLNNKVSSNHFVAFRGEGEGQEKRRLKYSNNNNKQKKLKLKQLFVTVFFSPPFFKICFVF